MLWKAGLASRCRSLNINWFDFFAIVILVAGGFFYLHDVKYWSIGYIGDAQYGDAQFWWDGALHFAQGIFKDNPGKGFRPGYFMLTGLTLPILGMQFLHYFPYFLLTFLMTITLFFLALRAYLGKWVSACIAAMIVINPFTAEWLATSTTDATGFILHLAALTCLLYGLRNGLQRKWLVAFGIMFALATLTRPLMTPFIALVLTALFFLPRESFKKRLGTTLCVLIAFCLPILLWMGAQKIIINEWSLSANEAGALYAPSDPEIQVWTPTMYAKIQELAKKRFHTESPSVNQLNHTFKMETVNNYIRYYPYHIKRIFPHILAVASFSPTLSGHGTELWRTVFLLAIALGLSLWFVIQGLWFRSLVLAALGSVIYISPSAFVAFMTIAGALFALLIRPREERKLGIFLLGCYWWMGVITLYIVGGTWGPPIGAQFALNALGYRLGSQLFFAGDLLAGFFIIYVAYFKITVSKVEINNFVHQWFAKINQPSVFLGAIVLGFFCVFFSVMLTVYMFGTIVVAHRAYANLRGPVQAYPALDPVIKLYQLHTGINPELALTQRGSVNLALRPETNAQDWIFTGAASAFIWNLQGQNRSQLLVHSQNQVRPITSGPGFVILEVPKQISYKNWAGKQGVFVVRQIADKHNESNFPYYLTTPTIRAFIPIAKDLKNFDLAKTVWFPLVMNATQLETNKLLKTKDAQIIWSLTSGAEKFQRRFFLMPQLQNEVNKQALLYLDTTTASGLATLHFSYNWGTADEQPITASGYYDVTVTAIDKDLTSKILYSAHESYDVSLKNQPKELNLSIPSGTSTIEITFNNLFPKTGLWLYEFNLSAGDFVDSPNNNQAITES